MSFPKQSEIELPLLKTLQELGGKAEPKELYPRLAAIFPQLTQEDLAARLPSSPSTFRWHNLVQWSRQKLVEKGEIDGSTRGVWKLTPRGRARATGATADSSEELLLAHQATLKDLVYENESEVKRRIISELQNLGATDFEQFCMSFLGPLGYEQLEVTGRGADRGIDGFGLFRQGVVTIRSAFQAKRWRQNPVSRPEIDKFRGAIQGDYDHGVFLTTGRFTADAEAASIKKGAISLLLLDGDAIAESMIRIGIGVVRRPVQLFDLDPEFFRFPAADGFLWSVASKRWPTKRISLPAMNPSRL